MSAQELERSHARVCAAVVVAGGLFERASALGDTPRGWELAKMAADAIDRTLPHALLQLVYANKPEGQGDVLFLAANLTLLAALPPAAWPKRKVGSTHWGEFTRVMRGLDEFLGAAANNPREQAANRIALDLFVCKTNGVLAELDQTRLVAQLAAITSKDSK